MGIQEIDGRIIRNGGDIDGLGTLATQDANNVSITGGSVVATVSDSTVTATGGTASGKLEDRFGRMLTVYDFGTVDNTGVADSYAAFNAAAASNSRVLVPNGAYNLATGDVTGNFFLDSQVTFTGTGRVKIEELGQWTDVGSGSNAWKIKDRLLVGDAADIIGGFSTGQLPVLANSAAGAIFGVRDSQVLSWHETGNIAITGFSKSSDQTGNASALAANDCIGVAGFVINDRSSGRAWALYSDVQHESGAEFSAGLEIALKNKASNVTPDPYSLGSGACYGIWIAGGGDASYGGSPTNPSAAGIIFKKNATTCNAGIVFEDDSLTGADGLTGTANAIVMGRGHKLTWYGGAGFQTASIRADHNTNGAQINVSFAANALQITGNNGNRIFQAGYVTNTVNFIEAQGAATGDGARLRARGSDTNVGMSLETQGTGGYKFFTNTGSTEQQFDITRTASAVNFLSATGAVTTAAPVLSALGSDTNIDLQLTPKGTGVVKFGTHSALAAETVTGYITIRDAGGTLRKLAVVS